MNNLTFKQFLTAPLNECVSVALTVADKIVLAKNRDRAYYPTLSIVHEIINGIEVVYMYDIDTDYSEGMNELGMGIVNTTLQGKKDEKAGKKHKTEDKPKKIDKDGFKIRKALGCKTIEEMIDILRVDENGVGGHNVIATRDKFISIEKVKGDLSKIRTYKTTDVISRSNHGLDFPDQGYQYGMDRESSVSRKFYATQEAREAKSVDDVLAKLRTHHKDVPGYLEAFRTNYKLWTSSQILLNLTDLEFTLVMDEDTIFKGVENRLPINYKPKIKIKAQKIQTTFDVRDLTLNPAEPE